MTEQLNSTPSDCCDLEVYAPGRRVTLTQHPEAHAIVLAVEIKELSLQYRVAWFDGGVRYAEWLEPCEISRYWDYDAKTPEKLRIGFV